MRQSRRIVQSVLLALVLYGIHSNPVRGNNFGDEWRWARFTSESGLPSDHVLSVAEASDGIPWVLTSAGLAWYDGYQWVHGGLSAPVRPTLVFNLSPGFAGKMVVVMNASAYVGDSSGFMKLPFENVQNAVALQKDSVLVLSNSSLSLYHDGEVLPPPLPEGVRTTDVFELIRTTGGSVWINTRTGLFRWRQGQWAFRVRLRSDEPRLNLTALVENENGSGAIIVGFPFRLRGLWVWENGGKLALDESQPEAFIRAADIANDGLIVLVYESGYIWVRESGSWSKSEFTTPSARRIHMVRFRSNGDLWVCSDRGLFLFRRSAQRWQYVRSETPTTLNNVNDILLAKDGAIWLATGGGVKILKPDGTTGIIERINGRALYVVTGLMEDDAGNIWISSGSAFDGAFRWNGKSWRHFGRGTPLDGIRFHRIRKDRTGRLWFLGISTVHSPNPSSEPGVVMYSQGTFSRVGTETGLLSGHVYAFDEGPDGVYWFGTMKGISRWSKNRWAHWTTKEGLAPGRIFTLAVDHHNQTWFSDRTIGIGMIDRNDSVRYLDGAEGPVGEKVWEIKVDPVGRIWCTTPAALYVNDQGSWTKIDRRTGLINAPLWPVLPLENRVYVGSLAGIAILNCQESDNIPARIQVENPIVSTDNVFLRWKTLSYWGNTPSDQIVTRYRINENPWSPWTSTHETMLDNLPAGTHTFSVQTRGLFGNLNSIVVRDTFTISLPFYRHPYFLAPLTLLSITVVVLGTIVAIRRRKQIRLNEELQRQHEHAQRIAELARMRSHFFANISHEFRTPLTLILGPIQKWQGVLADLRHPERAPSSESKGDAGPPGLEHASTPLRLVPMKGVGTRSGSLSMTHIAGLLNGDLNMMGRNAYRLLRLINQLLDLSKLEAGGMKLEAAPGNIVPFVRGIAESFESSAALSNIALNVEAGRDEIDVYFDRDKMEKVLSNLLSNALKFTPEGGKVAVTVSCHSEPFTNVQGKLREESDTQGRDSSVAPLPQNDKDRYVAITVTDTGIGIPEELLDKVFDRFYQVDTSQTREYEGTGIGLALTKELVELHQGEITVTSTIGEGTSFTIRLPLGKDHLRPEQIVEESPAMPVHPGRYPAGEITAKEDERRIPASDREPDEEAVQQPVVLVIEDNSDLRAYMRGYLDHQYRVLEAANGLEGLAKSKETIPDLIISDVMMPKMDGHELCKKLRRDEKTCHIPIILLTARAGTEDKIEGLSNGADDYVTKPFEANELLVRVKNLIEVRRALRERFGKSLVTLRPDHVHVKTGDETFLGKVKACLEKNMGREDFSVADLASEVAMSRAQLYRKLVALTNTSPVEVIRSFRLQRAKEMLEHQGGTVAEIAYSVGFSSPAYFTKCFHEEFGSLPSEVRKDSSLLS